MMHWESRPPLRWLAQEAPIIGSSRSSYHSKPGRVGHSSPFVGLASTPTPEAQVASSSTAAAAPVATCSCHFLEPWCHRCTDTGCLAACASSPHGSTTQATVSPAVSACAGGHQIIAVNLRQGFTPGPDLLPSCACTTGCLPFLCIRVCILCQGFLRSF